MQNIDDSHKTASSLLNGVFNEKKQSKKHRNNDQGSSRSSSSSQGSSRNGALVLRTSSSSEEDDKPRVEKTKRSKKPLTRHQFSVEDEDDERTDSADEGDKPFNPLFTQSNSYSGPMLRPLSPTLMSVGYGADLRPSANTHKADVIDITPTAVLESPNPPVPCDPISPDIQGGDSVLPLAGNVTGASVLPSPITNTLPFAGWYQPPLYSPFCGGSGSMATTPAAGGENGSFIPPGTSVMLHATICNESEGILIINVRWRNKSFSGSLIDLNRHQWAPPKLAEGFTDLQIQLKDLYKKQESEKVVVDIDGDTAGKDKDSDTDRNMEVTVTKEEHANKTGFSDVSDGSDSENKSESKLLEKKDSVPVVTADDGNHNKPAITLPSFDAVKSPQPEFGKEGSKNSTKEDVPSSPAEQSKPGSIKPHPSLPYAGDSGAEEGRSMDHHNLNTLVDVATKMKPVTGDAKPPDSDSSGSGSVSPEKKKGLTDKQQQDGGKSADNPVVSKQPDTPGLGPHPQLFSLAAMPPISPGEGDPRNAKRPMKPPPPPEHLRPQWSDSKPSVIPSIVSFSNIQHGTSPALYHQAPSVIQGNSGKPRKRKLLPQNETSKRMSPPPTKDGLPPPIRDGLPFVRANDKIPPLPMSFTSSRPEAPNAQRRDHHPNDQPPPGFVFDPSLPMAYDYQLISYKEQMKSSEESAADEPHFSKIIKRPRPIETHDALSVAKPTRSPSPNLRRPLLHSSMTPHDQRIQFSPHGNKPERPPSKDSHSVVKSHKKHGPIQRKPAEYPTHTIKKDPDGPQQPLFMSGPQGVFMPQALQLSSAPSQTVTHWPMATAIPQGGGKPIKSDPSEHHSSSQHRSTPSPHPIAKNKPHIVDNKPHIHNQHHGNKHDSSRHHISSNASSNNLSQISPTNTLRNGAILPQQVMPEEWLKMIQLEQLQNASATPTIPMALHHQELAMWQSQLMQQLMNAGRGDQALQLQQQLALQQQQQQMTDAAMAQAFASPGMVPFMPLPAGFQGMVPYLQPPTQKRDS